VLELALEEKPVAAPAAEPPEPKEPESMAAKPAQGSPPAVSQDIAARWSLPRRPKS